jgi:uncharacterized membrane protein YdjX (TVP38/TMEM64 family)
LVVSLKWSRSFIVPLVAGLTALAYLLHAGLRSDVNAGVALVAGADTALIREYLHGFGWWAPVVSTVLQLVTSIIAPLPSFMLAFANAMLFGVWWGALLTWSSALLAGAICFGISRAYGRGMVERVVPRAALASTDSFFVRRGVFAVVLARIIPFINPDVVSYAAGLTPMRWHLFLASIAVGSIPSTALYSYLGSRGSASVGWLFAPLMIIGVVAFLAAMVHHYRVSVAATSIRPIEEMGKLANDSS